MPGTRILVIDNEEDWLELVSQYLRDLGNYVEVARSVSQAQSSLLNKRFDVVFTNLHLLPRPAALSTYPRRDFLGVQVIRHVHKHAPGTPCFIISGEPSELNERLRDYPEYVDFFFKPGLDLDILDRKIHNLDTYRAEIEVGYRSVRLRVIQHEGRAGAIIAQITEEPIAGIQALMKMLSEVPELSDKVPALGVRLGKLKELQRRLNELGMLSDTQQVQWREGTYFAMTVCQELDVWERMQQDATS
jgi:CheY-like chemotaxis protein